MSWITTGLAAIGFGRGVRVSAEIAFLKRLMPRIGDYFEDGHLTLMVDEIRAQITSDRTGPEKMRAVLDALRREVGDFTEFAARAAVEILLGYLREGG